MGIATYPSLLVILLYAASLLVPAVATRAPAGAATTACASCTVDAQARRDAPAFAIDADLGRGWWQIRMALHVVDPLQAAARYEAVAEALGFRIGFAHDGARDATRFAIDPPRLSLPSLGGLFRF